MDLEVEIPIWFNGKMKWISNLTSRSTCSDVVRAILATDGRKSCSADANYHLYECWRGVERPLKSRCRLLKLWHSWAGECGNVTLTLRTQASSSPSTHLLVRQQEKRLERFQRQVKRTDKQLEKLTDNQHCVASEHHQSLITYSNLSRSIIQTTHQLERQEKQIARLIGQIELETRTEWNEEELTRILTDVNQTLIVSRELNEQSDELDGEIHRTNEEIDRKQYLLDELELDDALDQNIDLDSLDDDEDQRTSTLRFAHERVSNKDLSPSPPVLPQKFKTVARRPTAIVEPSLSVGSYSSSSGNPSSSSSSSSSKTRIEMIPFPRRLHRAWSLSTNEESDTGISSFNSTDDQLVTLV